MPIKKQFHDDIKIDSDGQKERGKECLRFNGRSEYS